MKLFELFATLELQTEKFNDGINKAQGVAQSFAGKVQSTVTAGTVALGNLMARGVEVAANAAKNITSQAFTVTGQLEQVLGGSEAVFGVWAEDIQQKSSEAFNTMGLSADDYLETANKMGSLFQGSGFTTVESFEMTADAMQRAADVASVMGIDTAWAMESIAGLAKGNYTMMDNLGVAINETTIAQYALEKGVKKSTAAMSTQEKVGLALELFMERTEKYAGNRLRENDTIVGAIESANAAWQNLLSGAENFTEEDFVAAIENAFNVVTRNMNKITPRLVSSFNLIAQIAIPKIRTAFAGFWNNDLPKLATSGANLAVSAINEFFGTNIPKIEKIDLPTAEEVTSALSTLWGNVTDLTSGIFNWTLGLFTPPDESIDHMGSLSAWWYGTALPFINDTFSWTVGIFQPPEDGVDPDGYIAMWWQNTVLPFLEQTCTWTLNMFLPPDENGDITPESVITGWWENVSGVIADACQWFLNVFSGVSDTNENGDAPETIIEDWWGTIVDAIVSACQWALGIFSEPVETVDDVVDVVSSWWSGVVGAVEDACVWFLGLFRAPKSAEDGNGPGAIVATWWNGVVDNVVAACQWFLGLFSGVSSKKTSDGQASTPTSIVLSWWKDTIQSIVAVCRWTIGSFFGVADVASDGSMKSPKDVVSSWWETTKAGITSVCTWIINSFSGVKEGEGENEPESIVGEWWETVKANVVAACQWMLGQFGGVSGTPMSVWSLVSTWWSNQKRFAESALVWTLQLFGVPKETVDQVKGKVSGWWENVVDDVQKVCTFVAQFLGFSETDAEGNDLETAVINWWADVTLLLDKICEWAFGVDPENWETPTSEQITSWWDRVKGSLEETISNLGGIVVSVGKLVLGESLETSALGKLGENVSSFLADLTSAINRSMGLMENPGNRMAAGVGLFAIGIATHPIITLLTTIVTNWESIKEIVDTVATAVDEFLTQDIPEAWNSFVEGIKTLWNDNVVTPIQDAWNSVTGFLSEKITSGWNSFVGAIQDGWNAVTGSIQAAIEKQKEYLGEDANAVYGSQMAIDDATRDEIAELQKAQEAAKAQAEARRKQFANPEGLQPGTGEGTQPTMHKKAVGLNYVPYNDFPSLLHEGEAVLNKAEATAWRRGEGTGSTTIDYDRMADIVASAVAQAVSGLAVQMDKQTVGTIVSPVVFREMGRQLKTKQLTT